jgi:hypothetical protein
MALIISIIVLCSMVSKAFAKSSCFHLLSLDFFYSICHFRLVSILIFSIVFVISIRIESGGNEQALTVFHAARGNIKTTLAFMLYAPTRLPRKLQDFRLPHTVWLPQLRCVP